jgi:hypothetical protein
MGKATGPPCAGSTAASVVGVSTEVGLSRREAVPHPMMFWSLRCDNLTGDGCAW